MKKHESDEELIRRADMIYQIMNFIFEHRNLVQTFHRDTFCNAISTAAGSCAEIIQLALEQGWFQRSDDTLIITPYAFDYEQKYWGTFR